jgi:ATP-dependent RNA helicase DDX5/DBP2
MSGNKRNDLLTVSLPTIDWNKTDLIPFEKNLYKEHPSVTNRTEQEVQEWRKKNALHIKSRYAPNPIITFEEALYPQYIMDQINKCGFKNPTPIQAQGWPIALRGSDTIGIACTGSGKTLAFILPALMHISVQPKLRPGDGPIALVLAPTRELSVQIYEECQKFARSARINCAVVYGGADKGGQRRELARGCEIVIATPGRLIDFLDMKATTLKRVTYLVLDEADRMLDMGFEPQIRKIVSQIRPDRQTLLWSATWPPEIQRLGRDFCRQDPVHIVVGSEELAVNHMIKQNIEVIDDRMKKSRLVKLLQTIMDGSKILIFCQTKRGCDSLARGLSMENWPVVAIHGDKSQHERDYVMSQFKTGKYPILVATDVAARGLDVKDIKYVVNFDFPTQMEDYVHRVGRTGRAGANGVSYTFFTEENGKFAHELIEVLQEAKQTIPRELIHLADKFSYLKKRTNNRWKAPTNGHDRNDRSRGNTYGNHSGGGGGYSGSHSFGGSAQNNGYSGGNSFHNSGTYSSANTTFNPTANPYAGNMTWSQGVALTNTWSSGTKDVQKTESANGTTYGPTQAGGTTYGPSGTTYGPTQASGTTYGPTQATGTTYGPTQANGTTNSYTPNVLQANPATMSYYSAGQSGSGSKDPSNAINGVTAGGYGYSFPSYDPSAYNAYGTYSTPGFYSGDVAKDPKSQPAPQNKSSPKPEPPSNNNNNNSQNKAVKTRFSDTTADPANYFGAADLSFLYTGQNNNNSNPAPDTNKKSPNSTGN